MRDLIDVMLKSERALAMKSVMETLKSNPYLRKEEAEQLRGQVVRKRAATSADDRNSARSRIESTKRVFC